MEVKNIIFDFDGVILNSHQVKTDAFEIIFKKYGNSVGKKAKEYHLKYTGKSRYLKFRYIINKILKNRITKKVFEHLDREFSEYCDDKIQQLNISKYLLRYLKKNHKKINFFISTGTPEKNILDLVKKKKIKNFFKSIHGSPKKKVTHINKILSKYKNRSKTLFIGDSIIDFNAAQKSRIYFLLKLNSESKYLKLPNKTLKFRSFKSLESKISSL